MNLFHSGQKDSDTTKDRYRIIGLLGRGTFSDVFNCFDTSLNRIVAIKQLRHEYLKDDLKKNMFLNETKLISYLDHPGVVTLYDSFISKEGLLSYTMKLNKGYTLREELASKTRGQMLGIFIKLCETLAYAHDRGVIHLDLNPDNIMLGQYGEVVITDWGNAILYDDRPYMEYLKLIRDAPAPPFDITSNHLSENSCYLSPEQIAGDNKESLSPSTDIFSMGVILFEMITGRRPFEAENEEELHNKILNDRAPLLKEVQSDLPNMLSLICAKMLEKDPFRRYHSFHDVLIDMDRFQNSGQGFSMMKFNAGDIIINEGEPGSFAFIVLNGSVEVSKFINGERRILARLGRNEIVGELAIFTKEPRTATVTASENGTVIRIMDYESVEQELQKLSPWVQNMITGLSKRFIKLNDFLVQ